MGTYSSTFNTGFDFALLNNRVSGSFDYYIKKTSDLIGDYTVSTQLYPTSTLTANVGQMENKGVEILVNAIPVKTDKFSWKTSINVAHNEKQDRCRLQTTYCAAHPIILLIL